MLNDTAPQEEMLGKARAERCRPDYETQVMSLKATLKKAADFRDAALRYFLGKRARDKMAELIGALVTECAYYENELDKLIQQQESDTRPLPGAGFKPRGTDGTLEDTISLRRTERSIVQRTAGR